MTQIQKQRLTDVPLQQLVESKTNPRRQADKSKLKDLTASIREKGVLVPLLVRPQNGHYEIVAGWRRFRAAKAAGLESVPAVIRELSDVDALEAQVIENLQREDVHPLDEADGYRALLQTNKYDVATLAAKVGKSESYIYQRLKLGELAKPVQKAFLDERITPGHAILLARLPQKQQLEALDEAEDYSGAILPVRELQRRILQRFHLNLDTAPWDKADKDLVRHAGACTTCPKRTGNNPGLFPDVKKGDTCTDADCYQSKASAFVRLQLKKNDGAIPVAHVYAYSGNQQKGWPKGTIPRSDYETGANCPHSEEAIVVDADKPGELGKTLHICRNNKCKVHHPYTSGMSGRSTSPLDRKKQRARKMELARRAVLFRALVEAKAKPRLTDKEKRLLLSWMVGRLSHDHAKAVCNALDWKVKKQRYVGEDYHGAIQARLGQLYRQTDAWMIFAYLAHESLWYGTWGGPPSAALLETTARSCKVDVAKLNQEIKAKFDKKKPKRKPKKKKKTRKTKVQTSAKRTRGK